MAFRHRKMKSKSGEFTAAALRRRLLGWYDRNRRDLPWRAKPGETADPYRVWLSEVMLQQTGVVTVAPYFRAFTARWATVTALAEAPLDDVLHVWAGLGYYSRARNLAATARSIAHEHRGRFPESVSDLQKLPGIGPYTAAAIAAIAFNQPAAAVDGNVERVLARLFAIKTPMPAVKREVRARAEALTPNRRPGDFWQAMMDLGATLCRPRAPKCVKCPLAAFCLGRELGLAESLPSMVKRKVRPLRQGVAFWLMRGDGAVLLRRRPERGLLGGMMEVPSTPWRTKSWPLAEAKNHAPQTVRWRPVAGMIRHSFTHFDLELRVLAATLTASEPDGDARDAQATDGMEAAGLWITPGRFGELALPTVMKKLCRHALAALLSD